MSAWFLLAGLAVAAEPQWYAMQQTVATQVRDPSPLSKTGWRTTTTTSWSLVSWRPAGERVRYDELLCGIETSPVLGTRTLYPDSFVDTMPVRHREGQLSGMGAGATFHAGPYVQVLGARLDPGSDEPLPADPADKRVSDDDRDGRPGVTVRVEQSLLGEGEVYVAQRSVSTLDGKVLEDGRIVGTLDVLPEQAVLDATTWWLRIETRQRPHPDPAQSHFALVPVSQESTCADVLADRSRLFVQREG